MGNWSVNPAKAEIQGEAKSRLLQGKRDSRSAEPVQKMRTKAAVLRRTLGFEYEIRFRSLLNHTICNNRKCEVTPVSCGSLPHSRPEMTKA